MREDATARDRGLKPHGKAKHLSDPNEIHGLAGSILQWLEQLDHSAETKAAALKVAAFTIDETQSAQGLAQARANILWNVRKKS
jgi:hypothetical protein